MLTIKQVEHIAKLASLELTEEEKKLFSNQLGEILNYAESINELDTENVEPTFHPIRITNIFREDEPGTSISHELALSNAPKKEKDYFKIPKIL